MQSNPPQVEIGNLNYIVAESADDCSEHFSFSLISPSKCLPFPSSFLNFQLLYSWRGGAFAFSRFLRSSLVSVMRLEPE